MTATVHSMLEKECHKYYSIQWANKCGEYWRTNTLVTVDLSIFTFYYTFRSSYYWTVSQSGPFISLLIVFGHTKVDIFSFPNEIQNQKKLRRFKIRINDERPFCDTQILIIIIKCVNTLLFLLQSVRHHWQSKISQ